MTTVHQGSAGWRTDPTGRHEVRFWDGTRWTPHVRDGETHGVDDVLNVPLHAAAPEAAPAQPVSILSADVLVVEQHLQLGEQTVEYAAYGPNGEQVARALETGGIPDPSGGQRSSLDRAPASTIEIRDARDEPVFTVGRPAGPLRGAVVVRNGAGLELGRIVRRPGAGRIGFVLQALDGGYVGTIQAESWVAWNVRIADNTGRLVVSVTKTWEGVARPRFPSGDCYVVRVNHPIAEPLRSLAVASALTIDTALKNDTRGFG